MTLPQDDSSGKILFHNFSDRKSMCWVVGDGANVVSFWLWKFKRPWEKRCASFLTLFFSFHPNCQLQSEQELEVLSVLPPGWQPDEPVVPRPFLLVPSTQVTFLAWQYRFVIELDLSPSTGIVVRSWGT